MAAMTPELPAHIAVKVGGRADGRWDWRSVLFRVVAGLIALMGLAGPGGVKDVVAPWVLLHHGAEGFTPELHRWHIVQASGLISVMVIGGLLAALPAPRRRPLTVQYALMTMTALGLALTGPMNPGALAMVLVFGAGIVVSYPAPRSLLSLWGGRLSRPLMALAVVAAVPLLVDAAYNAYLQTVDTGEHAAWGHWGHATVINVALALGGLMAASGRAGWGTTGALVGGAYLYFGASALSIPLHDGSWGITGGVLSLLAGTAFLALTVYEKRQRRNRGEAPATATSSASRVGAKGVVAEAVALASMASVVIVACGPVVRPATGTRLAFTDMPGTQSVEIRVAAGGLAWDRKEYEAQAGSISFLVTAEPGLAHDLTVRGRGVEARSEPFGGPAGAQKRLTLPSLESGTYQLLCTIPGHYEAGMVATLTVK